MCAHTRTQTLELDKLLAASVSEINGGFFLSTQQITLIFIMMHHIYHHFIPSIFDITICFLGEINKKKMNRGVRVKEFFNCLVNSSSFYSEAAHTTLKCAQVRGGDHTECTMAVSCV